MGAPIEVVVVDDDDSASASMTTTADAAIWMDPDFPPTQSSIDGRQARSQGTAVYCLCRVAATPHRVQSDGPNYGRFYLTCGRRKHAPRTDATPQPTNTTDGAPHQPVLNPYAKKAKTNLVSALPTSHPTAPNRPEKCSFFQWDPRGEASAPGRQRLEWERFGWWNGCRLVLPGQPFRPQDIQQGSMGDCWFLSALAVVAEKPFLIRQILALEMARQQIKKDYYDIQLCLDGYWQTIRIDAYLPVVVDRPHQNRPNSKKRRRALYSVPFVNNVTAKDTNQSNGLTRAVPAFCGTPQRQLWPALVEKAYAKAHGSYAQLSGGFIAEGLADLTGAPTETIVFEAFRAGHVDELWMKLLSFVQAGFVMGVATSQGGDGLVGGHAYSVLDVVQVDHAAVGVQSKLSQYFKPNVVDMVGGKSPSAPPVTPAAVSTESGRSGNQSIRLVRIRNPWGHHEWKGEWSSESERWTNALRERLGMERTWAKGDGTFFMSYNDMLDRFHHLDVAKTREVRTPKGCIPPITNPSHRIPF
jgi:calpain-15